ncbi:hypothetical protein D3C87_1948910 [compost metagenome]
MFNAQRPHRRQTITRAIKALFDTRAEQFGEIDVKGHGAASMWVIRLTSTDEAKIQDSEPKSANLYGDNTGVLNL